MSSLTLSALHVHHVTKIVVEKISDLSNPHSRCTFRRIRICSEDGQPIEIVCFFDDKLEVIVEE